jgi:hypothetical protein
MYLEERIEFKEDTYNLLLERLKVLAAGEKDLMISRRKC